MAAGVRLLLLFKFPSSKFWKCFIIIITTHHLCSSWNDIETSWWCITHHVVVVVDGGEGGLYVVGPTKRGVRWLTRRNVNILNNPVGRCGVPRRSAGVAEWTAAAARSRCWRESWLWGCGDVTTRRKRVFVGKFLKEIFSCSHFPKSQTTKPNNFILCLLN